MSDWIEWAGGKCPVPEGTVVDVRHRDGCGYLHLKAERDTYASGTFWRCDNMGGDIVAYRVCPADDGYLDVELSGLSDLDVVNHPPHYTAHPSGVECIQITEHMGFNLGNAVKYVWRADLKHDAIEDLKKARWYLDREIARREAQS
jgi:hypothetical protein